MLLHLSCSNFASFWGGCWCQGAQRNQWTEQEDCKPVDLCIQIKKGRKTRRDDQSQASTSFLQSFLLLCSALNAWRCRHVVAELIMNTKQCNVTTSSKVKWYPPARHFMVGLESSWLGRKLAGRWCSSCLLPAVLWMWPAQLRLSTLEVCVSGSPMGFFLCWW